LAAAVTAEVAAVSEAYAAATGGSTGGGASAGGGSGVDESIPVTEVNVLQHDLPGDLGKLVERRAVPGEL
jgi:hypothetical protein